MLCPRWGTDEQTCDKDPEIETPYDRSSHIGLRFRLCNSGKYTSHPPGKKRRTRGECRTLLNGKANNFRTKSCSEDRLYGDSAIQQHRDGAVRTSDCASGPAAKSGHNSMLRRLKKQIGLKSRRFPCKRLDSQLLAMQKPQWVSNRQVTH